MHDYHTLSKEFLQYKQYLGMKYETEKTVISNIVKYLKDNNINEITKEVTKDYARINPNLNSNTVARNMAVFREFCNFLKIQKGINCYQIPKKLYPQNHKNYIPYIFSQSEIKEIYINLNVALNDCHYNFYHKKAYPLIIKILNQTGMRIGEVLTLSINDYYKEEGYFNLKKTKNGQERLIVLPNSLKKIFDEYIDKYSFRFKENSKLFTVSRFAIENYFYKVLKLSNITRTNNIVLHSIRHTFVVHRIKKYIQEGKNIYNLLPILQVHLGHQSLKSLSYYFHITKDILMDIKVMSEENLGYLIPESLGAKDER